MTFFHSMASQPHLIILYKILIGYMHTLCPVQHQQGMWHPPLKYSSLRYVWMNIISLHQKILHISVAAAYYACCCCWEVWGTLSPVSVHAGRLPTPSDTGRCWPAQWCFSLCSWGRQWWRSPSQTQGWSQWRRCQQALPNHASWTGGWERGHLDQAVGKTHMTVRFEFYFSYQIL